MDTTKSNSSSSPQEPSSKSATWSLSWKWLLIGLVGLIIILLIFLLGTFVGYRKANFSFRWAENYHKTFGGPRGGFLLNFEGRDFISGHGIAGVVIKVESDSLVVKDGRGVEKTFKVTEQATIKKGMDTVKLSEIAVDNRVVIIGTPQDDGTIKAELIRVFSPDQILPEPPWFRGFRLPKI